MSTLVVGTRIAVIRNNSALTFYRSTFRLLVSKFYRFCSIIFLFLSLSPSPIIIRRILFLVRLCIAVVVFVVRVVHVAKTNCFIPRALTFVIVVELSLIRFVRIIDQILVDRGSFTFVS